MHDVASFPVPRPAFRRCLVYRTKQRRKAGRGTGNEAMHDVQSRIFMGLS